MIWSFITVNRGTVVYFLTISYTVLYTFALLQTLVSTSNLCSIYSCLVNVCQIRQNPDVLWTVWAALEAEDHRQGGETHPVHRWWEVEQNLLWLQWKSHEDKLPQMIWLKAVCCCNNMTSSLEMKNVSQCSWIGLTSSVAHSLSLLEQLMAPLAATIITHLNLQLNWQQLGGTVSSVGARL